MISNIPITPKSPSDPCLFSITKLRLGRLHAANASGPIHSDGSRRAGYSSRRDATDLGILGKFSTSPGASD